MKFKTGCVLTLVALLTCKTLSPTLVKKSPSEIWTDYYTKNREIVSKDLSSICERGQIYQNLASEYSKKFKQAGLNCNSKKLLDVLIAHEYVESQGNLRAKSKKNAKGPRQFIESTAMRYGLKENKYVNEVYNPVKTARAALDFMLEYSKKYGLLDLALLAYNAGPTRIKKVLNKHKKIKSINDISKEWIPNESYNYVHKINSIAKMLENPKAYGLNISSKKVTLKNHVIKYGESLSKIARDHNSTVNNIVKYNGIKNPSRIPANYSLKIPVNN